MRSNASPLPGIEGVENGRSRTKSICHSFVDLDALFSNSLYRLRVFSYSRANYARIERRTFELNYC